VLARQKSVAGGLAEHGEVERVQFQGLVGQDVARDVDQMPATGETKNGTGYTVRASNV
jgi:hypothetical protein